MRVGRDNGAGNSIRFAKRSAHAEAVRPGRRRGLRISPPGHLPGRAGHWTCICEHDKIGTEGLKTAGQPFERGRTERKDSIFSQEE